MGTELAKDLVCISMRNGVEIWLSAERAAIARSALLEIRESKFIHIDSQVINTADIVGIFTAEVIGDMARRRNGQWKCDSGTWHEKRQDCECRSNKREYYTPVESTSPVTNAAELMRQGREKMLNKS